MGQQMDKEAEPPLICSTENSKSGHTQGGRGRETERETQTNKQRDATQEEDVSFLCYLVTVLFTFTPDRAAKRSKRFRSNLLKTGELIDKRLAVV